MMRKLFVYFLSLCLLVNFSALTILATEAETKEENDNTNYWPKGPDVISESAVLMELSTGTVLYEKNAHERNYPASITKIMTVLLCLENSNLNETVTFSKNAIFGIERDSSHISLDVGEQITMEQTLYAIMLESANEAALGAGEHVAGSISGFADLMNAKAKSLGCTDTHFCNPNGLHNDDHYTSAYDMALITREAMKNPSFRQITKTKRYIIEPTNKNKETRYFSNHHAMIYGRDYPQYETDYVIGGKTGYTSKAGNTLVTVARKNGMELVCVLMRSRGPASGTSNEYTDTLDLFDYGFNNFKLYDPSVMDAPSTATENSVFFTRYNPLFSETENPIRFQASSNIILPNDVDYDAVKKNVSINSSPDYSGNETIIGNVTYTYGDRQIGGSDVIYVKSTAPRLITSKPVEKVTVATLIDPVKEKNLKPIIAGIISVIVILILIVLYFFVYRPKQMSEFSFSRKRKRPKGFGKTFHF